MPYWVCSTIIPPQSLCVAPRRPVGPREIEAGDYPSHPIWPRNSWELVQYSTGPLACVSVVSSTFICWWPIQLSVGLGFYFYMTNELNVNLVKRTTSVEVSRRVLTSLVLSCYLPHIWLRVFAVLLTSESIILIKSINTSEMTNLLWNNKFHVSS